MLIWCTRNIYQCWKSFAPLFICSIQVKYLSKNILPTSNFWTIVNTFCTNILTFQWFKCDSLNDSTLWSLCEQRKLYSQQKLLWLSKISKFKNLDFFIILKFPDNWRSSITPGNYKTELWNASFLNELVIKDLTIKACFILSRSLFVTSLLNLCGILNIFTIIIFLFSKNTNTEHSFVKSHPATTRTSVGLVFTHH